MPPNWWHKRQGCHLVFRCVDVWHQQYLFFFFFLNCMSLYDAKFLRPTTTKTRIYQGSVIPRKVSLQRPHTDSLHSHGFLPKAETLSLLATTEIQSNQDRCVAQFHKVASIFSRWRFLPFHLPSMPRCATCKRGEIHIKENSNPSPHLLIALIMQGRMQL